MCVGFILTVLSPLGRKDGCWQPKPVFQRSSKFKRKRDALGFHYSLKAVALLGLHVPSGPVTVPEGQGILIGLSYTPTSGSGEPERQDWHPYRATRVRGKWFVPQRKVCSATNNVCFQQTNSFLCGNPKNPPRRIETVPAVEFGTYENTFPSPPSFPPNFKCSSVSI